MNNYTQHGKLFILKSNSLKILFRSNKRKTEQNGYIYNDFKEVNKEMREFKKKQREEDNKRKYVGKGLFKKRRVWAKDVVDPKTGKVIGVKHPETGKLLDVRFRYGMGKDYKWTWRDIG